MRSRKSISPPVRVLLLMGYSNNYERRVLRGIREYAEVRPGWELRTAGRVEAGDIESIRAWAPQAIITDRHPSEILAIWPDFDRPIVNLFNSDTGSVLIDNAAVGRMAATYFIERGFRHFAFVGTVDDAWSHLRHRAYAEALRERDFPCDSYAMPSGAADRMRQQRWLPVDGGLLEWTRRIALQSDAPAAVFCGNDVLAREVATSCLSEDISIPDQISLLSVDDDEFWCLSSRPYLSSVVLPWEFAGAEAARLVDLQIGKRTGKGPFQSLIRPVSVATRQSSSLMAVDDKHLAAALAFIELRACDPIGVKELLRHVPVDRRWLERQFRRTLQRTPHEEIQRVRIERAKLLLAKSDESIPAVAVQSGFTPKLFSHYFAKSTGKTPIEFRRHARGL